MAESLPVTAVVPAAGLSRRFGGPNKLLQPWGEATIVGTVMRTLLDAGLPVIVVTGRDADHVAEACPGASAVFNPLYEEGLGASIAQGARCAPEGHGILIALGDMPRLRRETVEAVIARYHSSTDIIAPVYEGEPDRPGHPVLFGSAYKDELISLSGDDGARRVLQAHRSMLRLVPVAGVISDIDEPGSV